MQGTSLRTLKGFLRTARPEVAPQGNRRIERALAQLASER